MHPWHDVPIGAGAPEEFQRREFGGPREAVQAIHAAMDLYRKHFPG